MIDFPYLADLIRKRDNKILMLVLSGVGGPPNPMYGRSELDAARVPNLDHLSRQSVGGLALPVGPGISPGGTPGNLALLGYDPLKYIVARGPLEAIGTGLRLEPGDIAARGIVDAYGRADRQPPLVVRMLGTNVDEGKQILAESGLAATMVDTLEEAAAAIKG